MQNLLFVPNFNIQNNVQQPKKIPGFDSKNVIYMLFKLIIPSFGSIFKTL